MCFQAVHLQMGIPHLVAVTTLPQEEDPDLKAEKVLKQEVHQMDIQHQIVEL